MSPIKAEISFSDRKDTLIIKKDRDAYYRIGNLNLTLMGDENGGLVMSNYESQKTGEIISVKNNETKEKSYIVEKQDKQEITVNMKITGE